MSVLTKTALNQLSPRILLQPARNNFKHFGGGHVVFTIIIPVRYREQLMPNFTIYVVQYGTSILGQDLFDKFNLHIVDGNFLSIRAIAPTTNTHHGPNTSNLTQPPNSSTTNHPVLQQFSSLLQADPSKSIRGYAHKPIVNELLPPVAQPLRRVPLTLLSKVKEELDRMVPDGVLKHIEAADPVSNMVVAHKSNGAIRICVDFTNVNKAIVQDRYPLPTIDELAEFFAGSRVFSKIDLRWGNHQVKLHESSGHLTSMITPFGLYEWQRLPFGLCSAPSSFQKIVG